MRLAMLATPLLALVLGCMGGDTTKPPPDGVPDAQEETVELQEPWKSMGVPTDGVRLIRQDAEVLVLEAPGDRSQLRDRYAKVFLDAGWKDDGQQETAGSLVHKFYTDEGGIGKVSVGADEGGGRYEVRLQSLK